MNLHLGNQTLHIVSSVVLVGTGFGTAFYLFCANRTRSVPAIALVSRLVVRADIWFTTPAVIVQPVSGMWMARFGLELADTADSCRNQPLSARRCVLVACLQLQMKKIASNTNEAGAVALPPRYWRYAKYWEWLGYPAFAATLIAYWLMVFKPSL